MASVAIRPVCAADLAGSLPARLRAAQQEAGRLWTDCVVHHDQQRRSGADWPSAYDLHRLVKGGYALHSQTIQQIATQLPANVAATRERRRSDPASRRWLRYPYRPKRFFPLYWPRQAVCYQPAAKRLILPMGRGRPSLVFRLDIDFVPGAVKLVWNDGYELHLVRPEAEAPASPGAGRAAVDLGEIHQAAVVSDQGAALVISGRGLRSHKRLLSKQLGQLARKRARCTKGSKRHCRLQAVRQRQSRRTRRRVRDLRHKGIRKAITFCVDQQVGSLYLGDPRSVRHLDRGRHHNQRMGRWEVGQDIAYLGHKAAKAGIACSTGDERGTSSRCPQCGHRHKPRGRQWHCRACGFVGHRDVVGATNMHVNGFATKVMFPALVTYRRPGPSRAARGLNSRGPVAAATTDRRSRADTPHAGPRASVLLGVARRRDRSGQVPAPGLPGRRKTQAAST